MKPKCQISTVMTAVRLSAYRHRYGLAQVPTLGVRSIKTALCVSPHCRGMALADLKGQQYGISLSDTHNALFRAHFGLLGPFRVNKFLNLR